jgi:hypothetical protein
MILSSDIYKFKYILKREAKEWLEYKINFEYINDEIMYNYNM